MTTTPTPRNTEMAPTKERNGQGEQQPQQNRQMARFHPFALLEDLQDEFARLWGRPFGGQFPRHSRLMAQVPLGVPRVDMYEDNGYVVVKADVPGVKKEDIQVEVDNGDLVIQGETRSETETKEDQYYRMERRIGSFYRRIPLGFEPKSDDIQATMNDGVLEVRIPKPPEEQRKGKRIQVR